MKKTISIMTISLLSATTLAIASPSDQMDFATTISKIDSQVLFKKSQNSIIALKDNEMKGTKGKYYSRLGRNWNQIDAQYYIRDYMQMLDKQRNNNYFSVREAMRDSNRMFNIAQLLSYNFGIRLPTR
ncbi:hypothetical protein KKC13_08345 [bacterium]|nr:hypothetical protein [bacterium]MBU1958563.1 hypothetical protein [bacterium]